MKKKIAIIALIAIFVSVGSLSAQTKTVSKTSAKKEVKATSACCAAKDAKCCNGKTVAEKAKCIEKCNKATAKTGTKACTATKKVETKKI